ncbi:MAG TPA: serine dehydratase beta chain, partial [Steroidobacter sp.]|nr:serine dehydratase beta chain [Steroidobacter sp.]
MSAATISVFDMFKIGIGPSSSHTMGPMTAACRFAKSLADQGLLARVAQVTVALYGSLALTGRGHATDTAVTTGLAGWLPAQVDPDAAARLIDEVRQHGKILLAGSREIDFRIERDIHWKYKESLPYHPNALTLFARDANGELLREATFYSVGGGFVVSDEEAKAPATRTTATAVPLPFADGAELLEVAENNGLTIAEVMMRNECATRTREEVLAGLDRIAEAMNSCIDRGLRQ